MSSPKRFYTSVTVQPQGAGHAIVLDGKPMRTPGKAALVMPAAPLAGAIAEEWDGQGERIDPASMPLTKLANTAIDGVAPRLKEVADTIASYARSDLLCYRAGGPSRLIERQCASWDPIVAWGREALAVRLTVTKGVIPVEQPLDAMDAIRAALKPHDAFALTALHDMTALTGSVLLALAVSQGRLSPEDAWAAAHMDEDWQIELWGEDEEAAARRKGRWREMQAAVRFLGLAGMDL